MFQTIEGFPKERFECLVNRGYYTVARRYEFYVRVARTISHEWAQRTSNLQNRNPQTYYWRRASQIKQFKARGVTEEAILNVRNFLTITSTLLNPDDDNLGIVLYASCVSHFALYVAEPILPYVVDIAISHYGSRMDDHHRTPVHGRLRILVVAGVTFKPRYPDRTWCGWMHWRARF